MASDGDAGTIEQLKDAATGNGDSGGGRLLQTLTSKEMLLSAVVSAAGAVAAAKGPDLVRRLASAGEEKGEQEASRLGTEAVEGARRSLQKGSPKGLAGKAVQKALGGGGGQGEKKTRRLPIERWTDVAAPVDKTYDAWTKFDQFPKFMHRVLNVEQKHGDGLSWDEKIWFSKRHWEGRITERRENDRIAWKTTSGISHRGVVSFHPIAENLTRVMVTMEFEPSGVMEKMASGLRFVKRAVEADLARFKAHVELEDAKGIEYRPTRAPDQGGSNGDRGERKGDDEREAERQERESGRRDRRKSAVAR